MENGSRMTQFLPVIGTIDPQTVANSIVYTDVIDLSLYGQVMAVCALGNMASETIDFKAYYCDSDGSNPTALKSCTQLAASAGANDNTQLVISILAEELNAISEAKRYVKFGLITGNSTGGPAAVVVLGGDLRHGVATDADLSTVQEIKE